MEGRAPQTLGRKKNYSDAGKIFITNINLALLLIEVKGAQAIQELPSLGLV